MPKSYDMITYKRAIELYYLNGLTYSETARAVGLPMMTVKRWMLDFNELVKEIEETGKKRLDK